MSAPAAEGAASSEIEASRVTVIRRFIESSPFSGRLRWMANAATLVRPALRHDSHDRAIVRALDGIPREHGFFPTLRCRAATWGCVKERPARSPASGPALTADDVLTNADWVNRLARALVADPAEAADLAQDAWEAALTGAPAAHGPLGAWLTGVVRNLARMRARGSGRRRGREQAALSDAALGGEEAAPSPPALLER